MLTNFLMALPGGLDFCLANVFLECISVFSYSCPASYQRPVNVCVFKEKHAVCVVNLLVSHLLEVSWILLREGMLHADAADDVPGRRLHDSMLFGQRVKECLHIESVMLPPSPVFFTMRIKPIHSKCVLVDNKPVR